MDTLLSFWLGNCLLMENAVGVYPHFPGSSILKRPVRGPSLTSATRTGTSAKMLMFYPAFAMPFPNDSALKQSRRKQRPLSEE